MSELRQNLFSSVNRIVVKVGSRLLVDSENGGIRLGFIANLVASISLLQKQGKQVVLVSSGAVGAGMAALGFVTKPKDIGTVQACASLGQLQLMHSYENAFKENGLQVGQVLLSADDFRSRKRYTNIINTIDSLLALGIVPIVNENDSVAIDEIRVGDNDKLSADVTQVIDADLLIIFTDEDGLYNKNPKEFADAKLLTKVDVVNESIMALASTKKGSEISTGGMGTKLEAIQQATEMGCLSILANGFSFLPHQVLAGEEIGTLFLASKSKVSSRDRWISQVSTTKGEVCIDDGAVGALLKGASLLPVGVISIIGEFNREDFVQIIDSQGVKIARGLINFRSEEVQELIGKKSSELETLLGENTPKELIHRNNLVLQ